MSLPRYAAATKATSHDRSLLEIIGPASSALAVVAHPDDESFGLGAILGALVAGGIDVDLLCFTRGEASTLGSSIDLGETRRHELEMAAAQLGLRKVSLERFSDGELALATRSSLDAAIESMLGGADLLVMFEPEGVTGHADHQTATAAALRVADRHGLATLEWGIDPAVATTLRLEHGVPFVALEGPGVHDVTLDRTRQRSAMECHESQSTDNPVLRRRLELQGARERIRYRPAQRQ